MVKRFGEKLHFLREQSGMTLSELAKAVGLKAHGYISELESGKKQPSINFVICISKTFKVTIDELLIDEKEISKDR